LRFLSPQRGKILRISKANGSRVFGADGKEYIDLTGGWQVMLLGYDFEPLKQATIAQMDDLDSALNGIADVQVSLAKAICELCSHFMSDPFVSFTNSGSECAEIVAKKARIATGRHWVASCSGAYHGGLTAGLSLTFDGFSVSSRGYDLPASLALPYPYHKGHEPRTCEAYTNAVDHVLSTQVAPSEIAALFIEPVQAHGGVRIPCQHCVSYLEDICRDNGIILVADEVVTGLGRTGRMFGVEHFDISPTIFYLGKSIGGGIPLGAIVSDGEDLSQVEGGTTTCSGNLLACARGVAILEHVKRQELPARARNLGGMVLKKMECWSKDFDFITEARGVGLLLGLEFDEDRASLAADAMNRCFKEGLLLSLNGIRSNVIKLTPPLNIKESDLKQGLDIMADVLKRLDQSHQ